MQVRSLGQEYPLEKGMATHSSILASTRRLDAILCNHNVPAWFDYWGYDVAHDWCWWRPQIKYFMGKVLG